MTRASVSESSSSVLLCILIMQSKNSAFVLAREMAQEREGACCQLRQIVIQPSYMHHGTHTCTHTHTESYRHSESETNVIFKKTQHFFCSTGSVTWPEYTTHTASLSDICQVRGDFYGLHILNGQDTFMNRESTKTFDPLNVPGFVGFSQSREQ